MTTQWTFKNIARVKTKEQRCGHYRFYYTTTILYSRSVSYIMTYTDIRTKKPPLIDIHQITLKYFCCVTIQWLEPPTLATMGTVFLNKSGLGKQTVIERLQKSILRLMRHISMHNMLIFWFALQNLNCCQITLDRA